jgi:hypothetical protein
MFKVARSNFEMNINITSSKGYELNISALE